MHRLKKNNKGFSLIELIIVISIMVALIALMGPQYIKYIQRSRDASMRTAANDCLDFAKAEYADGNLSGVGKIYIGTTDDEGHISINMTSGLTYLDKTATDSSDDEADLLFETNAGLSLSKTIHTDVKYAVIISNNGTATRVEGTEDVDFDVTKVAGD